MASRNRTNAEWAAQIEAKIAEVEAKTSITANSALFGFQKPSDIVKYIDHTALKPESTEARIDQLCDEARQYGFRVCISIARLACNIPVISILRGPLTDHN
jgi:hypothetical protein